jgi:serine protease
MNALNRAVRVAAIVGIAVVAAAVPAAALAAKQHPASPRIGHLYRHGYVPLRPGRLHRGFNKSVAPALRTAGNSNLSYGGAVDGVGVTTGAPRVYLVFWGSQWGAKGASSSGYATFAGDPNGMAPDLQAFFAGLGTGGETWSGVMTQYCEGVATGAQTCASSASHVGYPTGGALAGVWADEASASPAASTAHQIAAEAVNAAEHFGNTTAASNRNVQYIIVSPTGGNPDGYLKSNFCAWHDYSGDGTLDGGGAVPTSFGPVAFTNLPYLTDVGASCGENFVNSGSAGVLDGVTIVAGHEYAETITDQFPAGGWTDQAGSETGDKCAWIGSGQGAAQDISLATGSFAVQSTWANDSNSGAGGCEVSHPIITHGASVTVTNPGNQSGQVGTAANLQIAASDSDGDALGFSATGLPPGLSISSGGDITGTSTTSGTYSVTVTASDALATGSTTFTWTIGSDFTITASPTSASVKRGSAASFTIATKATNGSQPVALRASGLPAGVTASFTPASVTSGQSSTMTLTTSSRAATGTFTITVTGTGSSAAHTAAVTLVIRPR